MGRWFALSYFLGVSKSSVSSVVPTGAFLYLKHVTLYNYTGVDPKHEEMAHIGRCHVEAPLGSHTGKPQIFWEATLEARLASQTGKPHWEATLGSHTGKPKQLSGGHLLYSA